MLRRILVVAALGLCLPACKDDLVLPPPEGQDGQNPAGPGAGAGGGGGGSGGGGPTTDAGAGSDAGGVTCTDLPLSSPTVDEEAVADDPLPGTGGVLSDGVYDLKSAEVLVGGSGLPGPTGTTYRSTIRVTGATFERVRQIGAQTGAPLETRARGLITLVAPNATVSLACPIATQEQYSFTATTTSIVLVDLVNKRRWTYTR